MGLDFAAPGFGPSERANAESLIALAVAEDLGESGDLTSIATIPAEAQGSASFVARADGVLAGLPLIEMLARVFGLQGGWTPSLADGQRLAPGSRIGRLRGSMRSILAMERIALNFLQRLSGVATRTAQFVERVEGTRAAILDTRKTTPGWRHLEKYAVRCGGGQNHRMGLFDAVLIKDNHLAWLVREPDPIGLAIASARRLAPGAAFLEIEVDSLDQFDRALACGADIILLDNLGAESLAEAVKRRDAAGSPAHHQASGGVSRETVASLAASGVDRISVGALTHSAPALDIGLDEETGGNPDERRRSSTDSAGLAADSSPSPGWGTTPRARVPTWTSWRRSGSSWSGTPTWASPIGVRPQGSAPTRSNGGWRRD